MQSTKLIGILLEDIRISHHTESVYVIEQELTKQGYICITFSTGRSVEEKLRYIKILEQRRVDGVILMGSMFVTKEVEEGIQRYLSSIPIVITNGYLDLPNCYGVLVDEEGGVSECVKYLTKLERQRIAFVRDDVTPSNDAKLRGFVKGMEDQGITEEYILSDASSFDSNPDLAIERGKVITEKMMKERPDIDAIIYSVDLLAIGGMMKLEELGYNIPSQVAVIGMDNTLYGKICKPSLTTLNNKLVETSQNAARILLDALDKKQVSQKIMLFTDIIERDSTKE